MCQIVAGNYAGKINNYLKVIVNLPKNDVAFKVEYSVVLRYIYALWFCAIHLLHACVDALAQCSSNCVPRHTSVP